MLKIQGTRNYLYQWDLNQKVIVVDNDSVNEVHFANEGQNDNALTVEVKEDSKARYAEIPNILLQSGDNIVAYEHCEDNGEYTFRKYLLEVIRRPKPADYVYTETEIKSYEALQADLDKKIDAPQVAKVGEVLTVEEVDEEGKPTKWKTQTVETEPPDWEENDFSKPGYIKNRTHYDSRRTIELFNVTVENVDEDGYVKLADADIDISKITRLQVNSQYTENDKVNTFTFESDTVEIRDSKGDGTQVLIIFKNGEKSIPLAYGKTSEDIDAFTNTTGVYSPGLYARVFQGDTKDAFVGYSEIGELKTIDPKYVKDLYYEEQGAVTLFESYNKSDDIPKVTLRAGKEYLVTVNGETYKATAVKATDYVMSGFSGGVILGDTIAPAKSPAISGNGFGIIQCYMNSGAMIVSSAAPYKIEEIGTVIHPVPSRYLGILQPLQSVSFDLGTEVKLSLEPYIEYRRIIGRAVLVPDTSYTGTMSIMGSIEHMSVKSIMNKFLTVAFTADRIGEDNSWIVRAWRECDSVNTTDTGDMFVTIHSGYDVQYFIAKGNFRPGAWELWGQP